MIIVGILVGLVIIGLTLLAHHVLMDLSKLEIKDDSTDTY